MRVICAVVVAQLFVGTWLTLHGCAVVTSPIATQAFGGAQLAVKGAELEHQIKKADVEAAIDKPFEKAWDVVIIALVGLDIELTRAERNEKEDGGLIEAVIEAPAYRKKVKVIVVKLTEKITEIGIWADHDKALAELVAKKVEEEALREDKQPVPPPS